MTASKCFIKYAGDYNKNVTERNIILLFSNNTINLYNLTELNSLEIHKQSIFVFSDLPCMQINKQAKFNFTSSNDIAAIGSKFEVNDIPKKMIPGKETYVNMTLQDGLTLHQLIVFQLHRYTMEKCSLIPFVNIRHLSLITC